MIPPWRRLALCGTVSVIRRLRAVYPGHYRFSNLTQTTEVCELGPPSAGQAHCLGTNDGQLADKGEARRDPEPVQVPHSCREQAQAGHPVVISSEHF